MQLRVLWQGCGILLSGFLAGCGRASPSSLPSQPNELLVLDDLGLPLSGISALVDGEVAVTDGDGRAELGALPESYDVVIREGSHVRAFTGMTTRSPTVVLEQFPSGHSLELVTRDQSGEVPNEIDPFYVNQIPLISMAVIGDGITRQKIADNKGAGLWTNYLDWTGPSEVTLVAEAILADLDPLTKSLVGYTGYATSSWSVTAGQTVDWYPDYSAPPFGIATIHLELDSPMHVLLERHSITMTQPSGARGYVGGGFSGDDPSKLLVVPDIPGATFTISSHLWDEDDGGAFVAETRNVPAGASAHARGSRVPVPLSPPNAARDVTAETAFEWSDVPGAIYYLYAFIGEDNSSSNLLYQVVTARPTAHLPDLSALGVAFPSARDLTWRVYIEQGHSSLDAYAAGELATGWGYSSDRTFTTAP